MRALRVDKMTLAALEATLRLALDPDRSADRIPLWAFLSMSLDRLLHRAGRIAETFRNELGLQASVIESTAFLGGGSTPVEPIPTAVVRSAPPSLAIRASEGAWARALRLGDPALVAGFREGRCSSISEPSRSRRMEPWSRLSVARLGCDRLVFQVS